MVLATWCCRQVVGLRRDNNRLREELLAYQQDFEEILRAADEYESSQGGSSYQGSRPMSAACSSRPGTAAGGRSRPSTAAARSRPGTAAAGAARTLSGLSAGSSVVVAEEVAEGEEEDASQAARLRRCEKLLHSLAKVAETERRRARQVGGGGRAGAKCTNPQLVTHTEWERVHVSQQSIAAAARGVAGQKLLAPAASPHHAHDNRHMP